MDRNTKIREKRLVPTRSSSDLWNKLRLHTYSNNTSVERKGSGLCAAHVWRCARDAKKLFMT